MQLRFWLDGTCIEADIHYPVDWVLLADITRTFLQVLTRIRSKGILNRMPKEPKAMLRDLNNLCIEISRIKINKKGGKKLRKSKLRYLRNVLLTVYEHVKRHMCRLEENLDQSGLSERQFSALKTHVQEYAAKINPAVLAERNKDPLFSQMQKRRAGTEGRIGILKNAKMNGKPRARTFVNRSRIVATTIVCHNLWVVASILQRQEKRLAEAA